MKLVFLIGRAMWENLLQPIRSTSHIGSDASSVWNFCSRPSDVIWRETGGSIVKGRLFSPLVPIANLNTRLQPWILARGLPYLCALWYQSALPTKLYARTTKFMLQFSFQFNVCSLWYNVSLPFSRIWPWSCLNGHSARKVRISFFLFQITLWGKFLEKIPSFILKNLETSSITGKQW